MLLVDSMILAAITGTGMWLIFKKLPLKMRLWLNNHMLVTRFGCAILTYTILGGTLHALFAAAWIDLFVSVVMHLYSKPDTHTAMTRLGAYIKTMYDKVAKVIGGAINSLPIPKPQPLPDTNGIPQSCLNDNEMLTPVVRVGI
jgi:hypothetical protein